MKIRHLFKERVAGFPTLPTVAVVLFTSFFLLGLAPEIRAQCSVATLSGTYGYTASGSAIGIGPVVSAGVWTFDGAGNFTLVDTESLNGTIIRRNLTGTYTVQANCTGSFTFSAGNTDDVVVVGGGAEVLLIDTDPGTAIIGDLKVL